MTNTDTPRTTAPATERSFSKWETKLTWAETEELYEWMSHHTPIAPAMEGDALTAEQEQIWVDGWITCYHDLWDTFAKANPKSNAALRDRLARVEERERVLRQWIEGELADGSPGPHDYLHGRHYALKRVLREMNKRATTTDGAAPPRRDEGETP
jgi:hypothetical protein